MNGKLASLQGLDFKKLRHDTMFCSKLVFSNINYLPHLATILITEMRNLLKLLVVHIGVFFFIIYIMIMKIIN